MSFYYSKDKGLIKSWELPRCYEPDGLKPLVDLDSLMDLHGRFLLSVPDVKFRSLRSNLEFLMPYSTRNFVGHTHG